MIERTSAATAVTHSSASGVGASPATGDTHPFLPPQATLQGGETLAR